MKFRNNQCVQINNEAEFKKAYPFLRSAKYMTYEEWATIFGHPSFPMYLENVYSAFSGHSIGFITKPIGTHTKVKLNILSLDEVL